MTLHEACVLGSDIGGTFTDVVLTRGDGRVYVAKQLTTPDAPEQAVIAGVGRVIEQGAIDPSTIRRVVHGTTLATNAVIERTGARVAYIGTEGFGELLRIGREARVEDDRYDLHFQPAAPPLSGDAVFEVRERIDARGRVVTPLDEVQAREVVAAVAAFAPEAVAICLMHSYANSCHEDRLRALLEEALPRVRVVTSSGVHPEMREFDRASTTLFTAEVAPLMAQYLMRLGAGLSKLGISAPLQIMESSGGVMAAEVAAERAVATLESGGAAGVMAGARFAGDYGIEQVISFDMGGTTAKAAVVHDGQPRVVRELHIGGAGSFGGRRAGTGMPVKIPTVDLAEVGSGGGSIAWLDPEGVLRVGPRSAGADPGPACYGRGGRAPTVTDANLVLGYLSPDTFAGGTLRLDAEAAHTAIEVEIARQLDVSVERAAWAIHEAANANMASAIHVVTVQRGLDPREHTLIAFGGAGPMHVLGVAERFGIPDVLAPPEAGVASAIGMQSTDQRAEHGRTHLVSAGALDAEMAGRLFAEVEAAARTKMGLEASSEVRVERLLDARFVGQAHEISIEVPSLDRLDEIPDRFRARYRELFGVAPEGLVEFAAFRVRLRVPIDRPAIETFERDVAEASDAWRPLWFAGGSLPGRVLSRSVLARVGPIQGPAIVEGSVDTIVVRPGWTVALEETGCVRMRRTT